MEKLLYKIVSLIFQITTIVLLFAICLHFGIIHIDEIKIPMETFKCILCNDYFINISCTILTAVALYIIQILYSKHKIKTDIRCSEIADNLYYGIEKTQKLICKSKELNTEIETLKNTLLDKNILRKEIASIYLNFYKSNKTDFDNCFTILTYYNNQILIDSVQIVFFINLNFKLLDIINNIKNRKPNLIEKYPELVKLYNVYEDNENDETLIELGNKINSFLTDIDFMGKYWYELLNYLGYNPEFTNLYIKLFKEEHSEYIVELLKSPIDKQYKFFRKLYRKAVIKHSVNKIKNFFKE